MKGREDGKREIIIKYIGKKNNLNNSIFLFPKYTYEMNGVSTGIRHTVQFEQERNHKKVVKNLSYAKMKLYRWDLSLNSTFVLFSFILFQTMNLYMAQWHNGMMMSYMRE